MFLVQCGYFSGSAVSGVLRKGLGSMNGLSMSSKSFPIALIESTLADFRIPIGVFVIMFFELRHHSRKQQLRSSRSCKFGSTRCQRGPHQLGYCREQMKIRSASVFRLSLVSNCELIVTKSGLSPETGSLEVSFEWLKSACPAVTRATGKK